MATPKRPADLPVGSPPWTALAGAREWEDRLPQVREVVVAYLRAGGPRLTAALRPLQRPSEAFAKALEGNAAGGSVAQLAGDLAGLGAGSTPAGDDFLIGAFHALWATGRGALTAALAAVAGPRTTRVSAQWLDTAARGYAAPAWRGLLEALAAADEAELSPATRRVLACGHTSGVASLLGFLAIAENAGKNL
jgi:Protein of unknown function (DUF2877)